MRRYCEECLYYVGPRPLDKSCSSSSRRYIGRGIGKQELEYCDVKNWNGSCKQFERYEHHLTVARVHTVSVWQRIGLWMTGWL